MGRVLVILLSSFAILGCVSTTQCVDSCDPIKLDRDMALDILNKHNRSRGLSAEISADKVTVNIMRDGCGFVVAYNLIPAQPEGGSTFLLNNKLEVVHVYRGL